MALDLADFGTSTMGGDEPQVEGGNVKGVGGFNNYAIDIVNPDANGDGQRRGPGHAPASGPDGCPHAGG